MARSASYAEVVLDISARALGSAFTYVLPEVPGSLPGEEQFGAVQVGCCVLVHFAHRPALGYVVALSNTLPAGTPAEKLRPLEQVLSQSYFSERSAQLARWIAREYVAPLSEAVRLFTPPGATPRLQREDDGSYRLAYPGVKPVNDRWTELTELGREFLPKQNAAKQQAIIAALRAAPMRVSELGLAVSGVGATLKTLQKRGIIRIWERRRNRGERAPLPPSADIKELTDGQQQALATITGALAGKVHAGENAPVVVLDGVTGSGKTEVYLQAIRAVLEQDKTAIVLVPEISLTPQTVARFRSRFGEQVAVLHSRLSAGERLDQWDLLREGSARVAVGARSALFAPLENLQLIIIDEEHESSYKQGSSPRYLSRDVAIKRAKLENSAVVLGSATPSLEALEHVKQGKWQHAVLPERASGKPLPPVRVVDLAGEFRAGNTSMFSRALQSALLETMERQEKAVLLLNRRGFSSFLLCRDCGYVPSCDNCSVSLTYHTQPQQLKCHHCGAEHLLPSVCPQCGSRYLKQLGPGTQYAYDQLSALLPAGTPIVRMDADSTRGKDAHEHLLESFIAAPYGVLLGTQMIAKGLDFPEVTLVGVLIADTTLKFPDFRAGERTFQLLEQVAGRAGRAEKDGRVIVQTYWPEHVAIRAAAAHNRELLLAEEEAVRQQLAYPPYARLANLLFWGPDLQAVSKQAYALREELQAALSAFPFSSAQQTGSALQANVAPDGSTAPLDDWQIIGPSPCLIARRKGDHRWHLVIKAPPGADIPGLIARVLAARRANDEVRMAVDIDPYDMM